MQIAFYINYIKLVRLKSGLACVGTFGPIFFIRQALFAKNGYTQSGNQFQTNLCDVHHTSESLGITSDKIADE